MRCREEGGVVYNFWINAMSHRGSEETEETRRWCFFPSLSLTATFVQRGR